MKCNDKIILRDFIESDIDKRIYWETVETEWQLWDAPWEYNDLSKEEKQANLQKYIAQMHMWAQDYLNMPKNEKRTTFQITKNDENKTYIGWCNCYYIDDSCEFSKHGKNCAVGIDIPETCMHGKGYAFSALKLFITYLLEHGETDIYTQTWSGNKRMIGLANKLGFDEYKRKENIHLVRDKLYDALTFQLNMEKFNAISQIK